MKKKLVAGLILVSSFVFIGCVNNDKNQDNDIIDKAIQQAELALANMEYDKALSSFNLAIEKGDKDAKNMAIKTIIEQYLQGKNLYDEGKFEESSKIVNSIDLAYKNYAIAKDVDVLKEEVKSKLNANGEKNQINKTENSEKLNSSFSNKDILAKKKVDYLRALQQVEVDAGYVDFSDVSTVGMVEAQNKVLKLWDDKLNEIYNFLKTYMDSNSFKKLEKEQIQWLKYRDKTAEAAMNRFEGGSGGQIEYVSSVTNTTKERCYELVNNYM